MSDAELASVDESILDKTSRNELARERRERDYATKKADRQDDANWKRIRALIAIVAVGVAMLALMN